ncbi:MAG: hypothetical protein AB4426_11140 [Xenococcaceae cyanobacterium]
MSESQKINDLYLKIAALERRISKLEHGQQELDNVVDPQGWIGEAFERISEDMDERFDGVDNRFDELNGKIDIILKAHNPIVRRRSLNGTEIIGNQAA